VPTPNTLSAIIHITSVSGDLDDLYNEGESYFCSGITSEVRGRQWVKEINKRFRVCSGLTTDVYSFFVCSSEEDYELLAEDGTVLMSEADENLLIEY